MPTENHMHHVEMLDSATIIHVDSDTLMQLIASDAVTHATQHEHNTLPKSGWVARPSFLSVLNRIESNDAN